MRLITNGFFVCFVALVGFHASAETVRGELGANSYGDLTVGGKHVFGAQGGACATELGFIQQSGAVGSAVFTNLKRDQGYHGYVYSTTARTTCKISLGGEMLRVERKGDVINAPSHIVQGFIFESRYPHLQGDDTWESRLLAWAPRITDRKARELISRNMDRNSFVTLVVTNMALSYVTSSYTGDIVGAAPYRNRN